MSDPGCEHARAEHHYGAYTWTCLDCGDSVPCTYYDRFYLRVISPRTPGMFAVEVVALPTEAT